MKWPVADALQLDLLRSRWECRRCEADLGPAEAPYKAGLVVSRCDARERHPLPAGLASMVEILEFACPGCGVLLEAEYRMPGEPVLEDLRLDLADLRRRAGLPPADGEPGVRG